MDDFTIELEKMKNTFQEQKISNESLRYCIVESISEKQYVVFDSENDFTPFTVPFGNLVVPTLNLYMKLNPKSVHYDNFKADYKENEKCNSIPYDEMVKWFTNCSEEVDRLINIIKNRNTNKYNDKIALKCAYIKEWKNYRYIIYSRLWAEMIDLSKDNEESYTDIREILSNDEIKELIESNHSEAKDMLEDLHEIATKYHFIPYDEVYFNLAGKWEYGRAWFSTGLEEIFIQDLYHALVDNAVEVPRVCPRCSQMYYSNNNKSKYCPDCKKQSADIRKENIKKNPARYLHKRVWDKINAHKNKYDNDFLNAFINESNYYWYQISGKKSDLEKLDTYQNIDTIEKYQEWLEKKLNSL